MKATINYTDNELVKLLGSPKVVDQDLAFKKLYFDNFKIVKSLVLKNNGSEDDAKDIFQDALIVLHRNVRKSDFELSCKMSTYIYSIARNLWYKKLRSSSKLDSLEDIQKEYVDLDENSHEFLEKAERSKMLNNMIDLLKGDCKAILKFYYYERMKMVEIAKEMGYSNEQVAKNKKSNCLKKLRSQVISNPNFQR
jgi:RNA polymerase sigma factor (sigma-70 family)